MTTNHIPDGTPETAEIIARGYHGTDADFNIFPALNDLDFRNWTAMFRRESEDAFRGINVTIMNRTAITTLPGPYSKLAYAFRPRDASAFRAALGRIPFIAFDILATAQSHFVGQHSSERRPASIQNGLRHSSLRQLAGIDVAHDDSAVGLRKTRRLFVKKVLACIRDLCVYGPRSLLPARALRFCKSLFVFPEMPRIFYGLAGRKSCKSLQAEINTNLAGCVTFSAVDLADEIHIPSATGILRERTAENVTAKNTAFPVTEHALFIGDGSTGKLHGARNEGKPAKGLLAAIARTSPYLVARLCKLAANGGNGVAMQTKLGGGAGRKLDKIEGRRPSSPPLEGMPLRADAVIPYVIAGARMVREMLSAIGFDAIFVCDNLFFSHGVDTYVLVRGGNAPTLLAPYLYSIKSRMSINGRAAPTKRGT